MHCKHPRTEEKADFFEVSSQAPVSSTSWIERTTPDSGIHSVPVSPHCIPTSTISPIAEQAEEEDPASYDDMPKLLPADQEEECAASGLEPSPSSLLPAPPTLPDEASASTHALDSETPILPPSFSISSAMEPDEIAEQLLSSLAPEKAKQLSSLMMLKAKGQKRARKAQEKALKEEKGEEPDRKRKRAKAEDTNKRKKVPENETDDTKNKTVHNEKQSEDLEKKKHELKKETQDPKDETETLVQYRKAVRRDYMNKLADVIKNIVMRMEEMRLESMKRKVVKDDVVVVGSPFRSIDDWSKKESMLCNPGTISWLGLEKTRKVVKEVVPAKEDEKMKERPLKAKPGRNTRKAQPGSRVIAIPNR